MENRATFAEEQQQELIDKLRDSMNEKENTIQVRLLLLLFHKMDTFNNNTCFPGAQNIVKIKYPYVKCYVSIFNR